MSGETNLQILLKSLSPALAEEEYVYCAITSEDADCLSFRPLCIFSEEEAVTVICTKEQAEQNKLKYDFVCKMITLKIHSSLDAVGLTAAISTKLADAGISANVVAAFYHDHVFVPTDRAEEAVSLLREFAICS